MNMVSALLNKDIVSTRKRELETQTQPSQKTESESIQVAADNLFNTSISSNQNSISETIQPSVSNTQTDNLFGAQTGAGAVVTQPSNTLNTDLFNGTGDIDSVTFKAMKNLGGVVYNNAKKIVGNIGAELWNRELEAYRQEEQGKSFYEGAVKPVSDAYVAIGEGLAWSAIRGVKDFSVMAGAITGMDDLSDEYAWLEQNTKLGQKMSGEGEEDEYIKFIREASNQIGYMLPTWFISALTAGTGGVAQNIAQVSVLFPSMFTEAYETYADLDAPERKKKVVAAIAGLINSEIELGFGIEGVFNKIKLPKLAKYVTNVIGEGGEESAQDFVISALGKLLGGDFVGRDDLYSDFMEGAKYAAIFMGADVMVDTGIHKDIKAKKEKDEKEKEIAVNVYLETSAKVAKNFDEFKSLAAPFETNEDVLKKAWKDYNATTEEGVKKVFETDEEYQSYTEQEEADKQLEENINEYSEALTEMEKYKQQKTLEEIKEEVDKVKQTQEYQELQDRLDNAAVNLASNVNPSDITSSSVSFTKPKIIDGKYVLDTSKIGEQGALGQSVKNRATREETEIHLAKENDAFRKVRENINAVTSVIDRLNESLNKGNKASKEDVMMVYDALEGDLAGKEGIIYRLQNRSLMDAIRYARGVRTSLKQQQNKIVNTIKRQAWRYVYRLQQESGDNITIGYSDFVLKHWYKRKGTNLDGMIKNALLKMSKTFNIDVSKVFEGCKIIFLDYQQNKGRQVWGSMEAFVDGDGTPIIPVSLNYVGYKESTVIHELVHGMDFIYNYRNGNVSITPGKSRPYIVDFNFLLSKEKGLYNKLLKNMTYGQDKRGYWTKPTEVMSRVFQEYYEVKNAKTEEEKNYSLIQPRHWSDFSIVEEAVNTISDIYRKEFGMPPRPNETDSLEVYKRKIDEVVNSFDEEATHEFFEALSNVGEEMKRVKEELDNETDELNKKGLEALLSELTAQWDALMEKGETYSEALMGKEPKETNRQELTTEQVVGIANSLFKGTDTPTQNSLETAVNKTIKDISNKNWWKSSKNFVKDVFIPLSTRLFDIAPRLGGSMAIMEGGIMSTVAKYNKQVKGFVDKVSKLDESKKYDFKKKWFDYGAELTKEEEDRILEEYGVDLKDEDTWKEYMKKDILKFAEDNGFKEEMNTVFKIIDEISKEYIAAGLKLNIRDLYLPREVKDIEALSEFIESKMLQGEGDLLYKEKKSLLERLQTIDDSKITAEERNRRIRNIFEELNTIMRASTRASHSKKRSITGTRDWGDEILAYYESPEIAITKYIESMVERTERAKFFARGVGGEGIDLIYNYAESLGMKVTSNLKSLIQDFMLGKDPKEVIKGMITETGMDAEDIGELLTFIDNKYKEETETSISNVIDMLKDEGLSPDKAEELKHLLTSYFNKRATPRGVQDAKNIMYGVLLGDFSSTLNQVADIGFALAMSPTTTLKAMYQKLTARADINTKDIGLEDLFEDIKQDRTNILGKILGKEFRYTLFKSVDLGMKDILLQTSFNTMHRQANSKRNSQLLKTRLELLYGKTMAGEIFNAYKTGEIRTDDKLIFSVLIDLAYQLGNAHPIFKSSLPVAYNNNLFARFLFGLKTYAMKVQDFITGGARRTKRIMLANGESAYKANLAAAKHIMRSTFVIAMMEEFKDQLVAMYNSWMYFIGRDDDGESWKNSFIYELIYGDKEEAAWTFLNDIKYIITSLLTWGIVSKHSIDDAKWKGLDSLIGEQSTSGLIRPVMDMLSILFWGYNYITPEDVEIFGRDVNLHVNTSLVQHPSRIVYYMPFLGKTLWKQKVSAYAKEHKKDNLWGGGSSGTIKQGKTGY